MQAEKLVSESDIFIDQEFQDEQEYFEVVTQHLLKEGKVKASFLESILQRERRHGRDKGCYTTHGLHEREHDTTCCDNV